MKTLGIFIISDRHADYLWPLAKAAQDKGMLTHIHFTGTGVRLVPGVDFNRLPAAIRITISRESAELFQVRRQLKASRLQWLVPSDRIARILRQCDCHLFL